jgi:hypothetical protein
MTRVGGALLSPEGTRSFANTKIDAKSTEYFILLVKRNNNADRDIRLFSYILSQR